MPKLKLPNRYGSVTKMSNASRRRKPYMIRITTGYKFNEVTGKSTQTYGIIGYAETREKGLQMLAAYREAPFELTKSTLTFTDVFNEWSKEKFEHISKSNMNGYIASYKACINIHNKMFREIKTYDLQHVIDVCDKNYPTLRKIKILFNQLYKYAMKNDICTKDYSMYVDIAKHSHKNPNKLDRQVFTKDEINTMWGLSKDKYYQIVLMLIYTGVRINELLPLKKENIHIKEQYFDVIESKTNSGIRKVPISKYILPFFKNWMKSSQIDELLHTEKQEPLIYRNYYDSYFIPLMDQIGSKQTPHACRHTFISLLAEANVNPTYSKMIVGHKGAMSLTEKVYTHIEMKFLVDVVNDIYYPDSVKNKSKLKNRNSMER